MARRRKLVLIGGRQTGHPREVDFLLCEIVLEGHQALLLGKSLHFASVHVHLREHANAPFLQRLLVERIGVSSCARADSARAFAAIT